MTAHVRSLPLTYSQFKVRVRSLREFLHQLQHGVHLRPHFTHFLALLRNHLLHVLDGASHLLLLNRVALALLCLLSTAVARIVVVASEGEVAEGKLVHKVRVAIHLVQIATPHKQNRELSRLVRLCQREGRLVPI